MKRKTYWRLTKGDLDFVRITKKEYNSLVAYCNKNKIGYDNFYDDETNRFELVYNLM